MPCSRRSASSTARVISIASRIVPGTIPAAIYEAVTDLPTNCVHPPQRSDPSRVRTAATGEMSPTALSVDLERSYSRCTRRRKPASEANSIPAGGIHEQAREETRRSGRATANAAVAEQAGRRPAWPAVAKQAGQPARAEADHLGATAPAQHTRSTFFLK